MMNSNRKKRCLFSISNETMLQRVKKFKNAFLAGPYYVCVSCNRTLYRRSVLLFSENKYKKGNFQPAFNLVKSFDDQYYICKTCDKKLLKQSIPCQSVENKLQIFEFPSEVPHPNLLERVLISQRILFRKISIMPKGQFPKIRGSICNIPIQTDSICEGKKRAKNLSINANTKFSRKSKRIYC